MPPRGGPRPGSGRPRVETAHLHIRCSPERMERYRQAADKVGRPLSEWIRRRLDRAAEEVLGDG